MQKQSHFTPSLRLFPRLAFITALLTLGLIVLGAVVRVSDSGLGCSDSWPLCEGKIIPPLDNLAAWIEWSHRLLAALIGLFGLVLLFLSWRDYRVVNRRVPHATTAAALLFALQSVLGAVVVVLELPPTMVALHLGTAMLLLGALLLAAIVSSYRPAARHARDQVTKLVYATTALALVIILTGAVVRGSGATLACATWPLCNGQVFPSGQGQLAAVHMLHRFAVAGLGASLVLMVWSVMKTRAQRVVRALAGLALVVYVGQGAVGAAFVFSRAEAAWGAAHVGLATTTWALLVALSVVETLHGTAVPAEEREWKPQSEPISN